MLESGRAAEAAGLIWRHWQAGTVMAGLPDGLRPETRAEGYAVQAGLGRVSATPPFGWPKITSGTSNSSMTRCTKPSMRS